MPVERRGQAIHARSVRSTGNRRNCSVVAERAPALLNGKSRVSREAQARFHEGLGVHLPGATRPATDLHCSIILCENMALTIGTQLGSHEIIALLGEGGMGVVYRARDTKLERD